VFAVDMEDVSPDDWFYHYVRDGRDLGLIVGTSEEEFRFEPHRNMTRAEFVTLLGRLHELRINAIDVPADDTFYGRYLAWAVDLGIVHGNEHGDLMPYAPLTREQMAVIVDRYIHIFRISMPWQISPPILDPSDSADISDWASSAVYRLSGYSLLYDTTVSGWTFRPQAHVPRTEAVAILMRLNIEMRSPL